MARPYQPWSSGRKRNSVRLRLISAMKPYIHNQAIAHQSAAALHPALDAYHNRRVLITGGLGFIGSNLAIRLVESGAKVTVIDSMVSGCGANQSRSPSPRIPPAGSPD